jgi:glycosyltransferase involved in cell wall biosynthesis
VTIASTTISDDGLPRAAEVDVLLLLEGTFPYVSGGVSSWVDQIIRGFPQIRFGAIFIGSRPEDYGPMRYALPDNLIHLERVFLHEPAPTTQDKVKAKPVSASREVMSRVDRLHTMLHQDIAHPECPALFAGLVEDSRPGGKLDRDVFLHSREAWDFITQGYRKYSTDPSFVDYFWTVRIIHAPIWVLRQVASRAPRARIYHSVSTGYAGLLGAILRHLHQRPFMLTEHGIYVKERKIDLYQASWIRDNRNVFERNPAQIGYFRELWIRFFEHLGFLTYQSADDIIALYEANRHRQILDGAPEARTMSIPNGVSIERFRLLREQRQAAGALPPPVLCLIGRVVPIKDVKTFIRAMCKVRQHLPDAEAWIAGPTDEDPGYADECRQLVTFLGLEDCVRFLGFQQMTDLLPKIGLVVLSSISEALPLVVLEGFAAGVPALVTDVGSCRQLIEGLPGEDAALGAAGRVVRIADPEALADAALELLTDADHWALASQAAIRRVERSYSQELLFARYRALYEKNFAWQG